VYLFSLSTYYPLTDLWGGLPAFGIRSGRCAGQLTSSQHLLPPGHCCLPTSVGVYPFTRFPPGSWVESGIHHPGFINLVLRMAACEEKSKRSKIMPVKMCVRACKRPCDTELTGAFLPTQTHDTTHHGGVTFSCSNGVFTATIAGCCHFILGMSVKTRKYDQTGLCFWGSNEIS